MAKIYKSNFTKEDISQNICKKFGISKLYSSKFIDDTILVLKKILKDNGKLNIANFGSFKLLNKQKRIGRNPKTKELHYISSRNSVSFKISTKFKKKLNENV